MSEAEGKVLLNRIIVAVVSGLILHVIVVGGLVLRMSYKSDLVNRYQDNQITELKDEQKEIKRDIKQQYYALTQSIEQLRKELE